MFNLFYYYVSYNFLVLIYLWFRYLPVLFYKQQKYARFNRKATVVIPCYNEKYDAMIATIKSVKSAYNVGEIIVVDDGSTNGVFENVLKKFKDITALQLPENKGKRHAQELGFQKAKYSVIVTIDSDTIIDKWGIYNLIQPFSDKSIGAVTGLCLVSNKNENLLTKMIDARYNSAFRIERKGQSLFGTVTCCSGAFSAYRTDFVKKVLHEYTHQYFLGKLCNFGDDRNLTNLALKYGYRVVFQESAHAYTDVPTTLKSFIKQQTRWTQSFFRENFVTMKYMFKRSSYLSADVIMSSIMPLFSLIARISVPIFLIMQPSLIVYYILTIIIMSIVRNLIVIESKEQFVYYAAYGFLHTTLIYWLYYIAAFKVLIQNNTKWGTR